jgi:signal transduction histidine kinase
MTTSISQAQQRREQFMANPVSTVKELEKPFIRPELSVADVLSIICNAKALSILKAVALAENDCSSILITKLKLTRKQYYSNMERLTEVHTSKFVVEADKGKIVQVISNILSNAIRFAKEGDVIISIVIKDQDDGKNNNSNKQEAVVSIKDTGTGIDPDVFPNLFSKFGVIHETSGNGLGLFISKNIIEAHGGRIWAENNTSGKGATFSFSLPIKN